MTEALTAAANLLLTLPEPRPEVTVTTTPAGVDITLDGDEAPIVRVMALALLADTIGDEDGPESISGLRYALGTYEGVVVLVRTAISAADQAELRELAAGLLKPSAA